MNGEFICGTTKMNSTVVNGFTNIPMIVFFFFKISVCSSLFVEIRLYKMQVFHVIFVVVYICLDVIFKCTSFENFEIPLNHSLLHSSQGMATRADRIHSRSSHVVHISKAARRCAWQRIRTCFFY